MNFDTFNNDPTIQQQEMFKFIGEEVLVGETVLVAVHDTAEMSATGKLAMQMIGAYGKSLSLRDSYAAIGVKGLPLGQALEYHSPRGNGAVRLESTAFCGDIADLGIDFPVDCKLSEPVFGPCQKIDDECKKFGISKIAQ